MEEWEIDLAKLDIRHVIAHGMYGTVYHCAYDGQDVAVKILDWGEDGIATAAETAALRASLSYLHSKKIVHRDVKTENMMLDTRTTLKIADFGVLDGKPYNMKCDVYSFGICLWEIYCCDMLLCFSLLSHQLINPQCCPSTLASVMRKCKVASPDKRPKMEEVVKLLDVIDTSKGGGMIPEDQSIGCFCFGTPRSP
ncbi:unnamed protein product [Malus baccata var. baccata]